MSDTITTESGTYRARIEIDPFGYDFQPDGCWFGTVYQLETDYWHSTATVLGQDSCIKSDLSSVIGTLWADFRDMDQMAAVLRGLANTCDDCGAALFPYSDDDGVYTWTAQAGVICPEWEGEDSDWHKPRYEVDETVVGFDYIERDYGKLINVVTLDDLKHWGWESRRDFNIQNPGVDPSVNNLKPWEAWANGEIYTVVIEQRVGTRTIVTDLATGNVLEDDEDEDWREVDSCGGYYGSEDAEQSAHELLAHYDKPATASAS